jgi:hypothetical protein
VAPSPAGWPCPWSSAFRWWLLGTLTAVAIHLASYRLAEVRKPALPRRRRRVGPPMEWIDD